MKKSNGLSIFLLVLQILSAVILVATLVFCIIFTFQIKADVAENSWAGIGVIVVIVYGVIGNGVSAIVSLVGLITSIVSKSQLSKLEPSDQLAYLNKRRKTDIVLFCILIVFAVALAIAEILLLNIV